MTSLFRWITLGVFLTTSPFVAIGAQEAYQTHIQLRESELLPGKVIANHLAVDHRDGLEEHAYRPEVTFATRDGTEHHFTDGAGSLPPDYAVGEPVAVLYDGAQPEKSRISSWKRLWLVPTLFIIVGLFPGWRIARVSAKQQSA
jgi:hypothetical protein